jgi:hypothetical protein
MRLAIFILLLSLVRLTAGQVEIVSTPGEPGDLSLPKGDTTRSDWHRDHGPVAKILGDSIAKVRIVDCDKQIWQSADEARACLQAVLEDAKSETFEAPTWAQPFDASLKAVIEFKDGKRGIWVLQSRLSCFQDASGKYWFAMHQNASALKSQGPQRTFTTETNILAVSREDQTEALKTKVLEKEFTLRDAVVALTTFKQVTRDQYYIYAHRGIGAEGTVTLSGGKKYRWDIEPGYAARVADEQGAVVYLLAPSLKTTSDDAANGVAPGASNTNQTPVER